MAQCRICDKTFEKNRSNQLCCSKECGIENKNRLRREWHKAKGKKYHREYRRANKEKIRKQQIQIKYGLSPEEHRALGDNCNICGTGEGRMCVDHDHETGEVRGLLCQHCNVMLGMSRDSVDTLKAAIFYLESRNKSRTV